MWSRNMFVAIPMEMGLGYNTWTTDMVLLQSLGEWKLDMVMISDPLDAKEPRELETVEKVNSNMCFVSCAEGFVVLIQHNLKAFES